MAGGLGDGGSAGLGQLIADGHGGALRSDFQRYYGLDLVDIWRGKLSPRRAWQLAEYLPPDSALSASLGGVLEHRSWTLEARLLAAIFNAIRIADYANIRVSGGKGSRPETINPPEPKVRKSKPKINLAAHPLAQRLGGS